MIRYFLHRVGYGILVLAGIAIILGLLFFTYLNNNNQAIYEMTGQNTSAAEIERIRDEYHMNKPVLIQLALYLNDLSPLAYHSHSPNSNLYFKPDSYHGFRIIPIGNQEGFFLKAPYLRRSYQTQALVGSTLLQCLPGTLILALSAMILASILGIFFGIVSTWTYGRWPDKFLLFISTLGMSVPSFFIAIVFSWLFGYVWHAHTGLNPWGNLFVIDDYTGQSNIVLKNLILPSVTLGIRPLAVIMQLTRNNLYDVMSSDYIRTARSKGLGTISVILKHALRNALNPVITAISGWLGSLLAGAVFVEYIFGWRGLGREMVNGLQKLDYPVVMGSILTIATMFVLINLLVDLLYGVMDPRIRR